VPGSPCCLYLPRYLVQFFVPPTFPNVGGTSKQIIMSRPIERTEIHFVVVVLINMSRPADVGRRGVRLQ